MTEYASHKTLDLILCCTLTFDEKVVTHRVHERNYIFILQRVSMKSFGKDQFPHKSIDLFFILVMIKNKLMDFCGNFLLQNDFLITFF